MPRPETDREIQPAMVSDGNCCFIADARRRRPRSGYTVLTPLIPLPSNTDLLVAPPSVPSSLPSVPLIQQQETLQLLQAGRWVELASSQSVQQYLQHHCPVCYQWCADAVGLKHHMAHVHSSWLASRGRHANICLRPSVVP